MAAIQFFAFIRNYFIAPVSSGSHGETEPRIRAWFMTGILILWVCVFRPAILVTAAIAIPAGIAWGIGFMVHTITG